MPTSLGSPNVLDAFTRPNDSLIPALTSSGSPTFTAGRCQLDSSDRIQAPNTLLDETQGWMAFRVRMGFAWNGGVAAPRLFEWADGANGDLQAAYDTSAKKWYMYRDSPLGSAEADSAVQSFAAGDDVTIVAAWRADKIGISVNGGAFVWAASTPQSIPVLAGTLDLGNSPGANRSIASDYHWVLAGTGIIDNAEAFYIHQFGNTNPDPYLIPDSSVLLWGCDSLAYGTPYVRYALDPDAAGYTVWNVAGNKAVPSGNFSAVWYKTLFPADQEITVTIATMPVGGAFRIYARMQNPGTATHSQYELECDAGNSYISKHVAGSRIFLAVAGGVFHAGDKMTLRCVGNQIIALKNGVELNRVTDGSVVGPGYLGFLSQNDSSVSIDDFASGVVGPAAASPAALTLANATPRSLTLGDPNS